MFTYRRLFMILLSLLIALFSLFNFCYAGTIIKHDIDSPAIAKNMMNISSIRHVLVYLPDGYNSSNQRYPVIYWICGWGSTATGGEEPSDEYRQPLDDAIKAGKIPPMIAVFLSGGMIYFNSTEFGNWEGFLTNELIPFIDNTYRTYPDKSKRAIMGHSMGGYSAMILPILHPNVWGAVGSNDGAPWVVYNELLLAKEEEVPESIRPDYDWVIDGWKNIPAKIEDYKTIKSDDYTSAIDIQLGVTISPNPAVPLHFDVPVNKEGKVVPDVLEKWRAYCLMDPGTIAKNRKTLSNLSMIAIIVPTELAFGQTNRYFNILMIDMLKAEGISSTRLDMPGAHNDFHGERFIALAESILSSMDLVSSVSSKNKLSVTWGQIKSDN